MNGTLRLSIMEYHDDNYPVIGVVYLYVYVLDSHAAVDLYVNIIQHCTELNFIRNLIHRHMNTYIYICIKNNTIYT